MRPTSVSEIHAYPLRPEGFEEPLFPTAASRRAVAEHLLEAPWLARACELTGCGGQAARAFQEPVDLEVIRGRVYVARLGGGKRCPWRKRRLVEVLDSWREIGGWWEDRYPDRFIFRVLLSGGIVLDLARERSGGWLLVGMVD